MTGAALTNWNDDWPNRPSLTPSHTCRRERSQSKTGTCREDGPEEAEQSSPIWYGLARLYGAGYAARHRAYDPKHVE
jgi:hypothetical protein